MIRSVLYLIPVILISCYEINEKTQETAEEESHKVESLNQPVQDSVNTPDINSDSVSLFNNMGQGIMSLRVSPNNHDSITLYKDKELKHKLAMLYVDEGRFGWEVKTTDSSFKKEPFKYATNFENFGFIWRKNHKTNKEIILNKSMKTAWVDASDYSKAVFIKWESYLIGSVIPDSGCIIYSSPDITSNRNGKTHLAYFVLEVQNDWIKIAPLDPKNPSQNEFPPIGWIQWYRNGKIQILIADDTIMEGYYFN